MSDLRDKIAAVLDEYSVNVEEGQSLDYVADAILTALNPDAIVQAALEAAADHFAQIASKTPLGHENVQHGASTYNWLRSHEKFIRALAADPEARAKIIENATKENDQ